MNKAMGIVLALGFTTMLVQTIHDSEAISYLTDDPKACVNCHNMRSAYNSWQHSAHSRATTCNSCHVPQDSVIRKYAYKAADGLRHAAVFTLRAEPQNLMLNEAAESVVQENCLRCHGALVETLSHPSVGQRTCWSCHTGVPHGALRSISASPILLPTRSSQGGGQ